MIHGNTERKPLSSAQLVRIRKALELLVFGFAGTWFYLYGPVWSLPRVVREIFCAVITMSSFVIYRVAVHTAKEQFLAASAAIPREPTRVKSKVYHVPRRFGMLTIVFATLGIALLAALLQALEVPPQAAALLLGLLAIVAVMQAVMDRVPRSASILAGVIYAVAIVTFWTVNHSIRMDQLIISQLVAAVLGAVYGYVVGTVIAGLFMGGETLSRWWSESSPDESPDASARQSPWD